MKRSAIRRKNQRRIPVSVRVEVEERSCGVCEALIDGVCVGRVSHLHHIRRRSQGGEDVAANLLALCAFCHEHIHRHPGESYDHGWLRRTA